MKEKPACEICHATFTRRANMLRHMKDLHGLHAQDLKKGDVRYEGAQLWFKSNLQKAIVDKPEFRTGFDKSLDRLAELTQLSGQYVNSMSSLQTTENLRRQLASRENEIKYINSNFWLLALKEIQGLSGYICRRCKQLGFTPVRNLGYDMTMLARHKCDETKVKSIKMCSIRKSDRFSVENFIASRMLDFLKLCMPGQKYIFSQDISNTFNSIENIYGLEIAKKMYGIADRIYYYSVDKSEKKDWLKRVLKKLGARTRVEEFEIKDFLMMIKSTYGIIDVLDGEARKRIIITLVS